MQQETCIIVGAGPCGLAAAIALEEVGITPLLIEKGNVVNAIYHYPTHQTFFSTSEKLEIGGIPFITDKTKPGRMHALTYYREVVKRKNLNVNTYEKVESINKRDHGGFSGVTNKAIYETQYIVLATGYYDHPNLLGVPGEELTKVFHYFKEAHPYFDKDVVVIGGKNSAVDAALELTRAGARVTVIYRGKEYSPSVKPWILPEFDSYIRQGMIRMEFEAHVKQITEKTVCFEQHGVLHEISNDFVFAMTGYHPDHSFLKKIGIEIDSLTGRPVVNEDSMETTVKGIYIAGVLAAGNNANEIFIENGRFHGDVIASHMKTLP